MKNLLVTVSGGESSAVMALHIAKSEKYKKYNKLFIFANTGKEREETLIFLVKLEKLIGHKIHWVEAVVTMKKGIGIEAIEVDYQTASRNGEPFKAVIEKESFTAGFGKLPNSSSPYCSGRLKEVPCHKFAKEYFGTTKYIKAIGMRLEDMPKRVSWAQIEAEKDKKIYPLLTDFELPISKPQVRVYLKTYNLSLNLKSYEDNCTLCPKKSERKLIRLIREGADTSFWKDMEVLTGDQFYRNRQTIGDLIAKAKQPYTPELFSNEGEACFCGG